MSSQKTYLSRRVPQQERAERRVESMLSAAEAVIAEHGFGAATMTEIAARAQMSIGALYQYFPNKDAIAAALRAAYGDAMDLRWSELAGEAQQLPVDELAAGLVALLTGFVEDHPAYLLLYEAAVTSSRSADARRALRRRFADLFAARAPSLGKDEALRIAEVALMIVKGLPGLYAAQPPAQRRRLQAEVVAALAAYLRARLGDG